MWRRLESFLFNNLYLFRIFCGKGKGDLTEPVLTQKTRSKKPVGGGGNGFRRGI